MQLVLVQKSNINFVHVEENLTLNLFRYADRQVVLGEDEQLRHFNHPFMQSLFMFIGEAFCFLAFKILYYYYNRRAVGIYDFSFFEIELSCIIYRINLFAGWLCR